MIKRLFILQIAVLLLLLLVPPVMSEEKSNTPIASLFPEGASLYFEVPDINSLLGKLPSTAMGKLFSDPDTMQLLDNSDFYKRFKALIEKSSSLDWGLALSYNPQDGYVMVWREKQGRAREIYEALCMLDSEIAKQIEPVEGSKTDYKLGSDWLRITDNLLIISETKKNLDRITDKKKITLADTLRQHELFKAGQNDYIVYVDAGTFDIAKLFDGWETQVAEALGLTSVGTIVWCGSVRDGIFVEKADIAPCTAGWKSMAVALRVPMPVVFNGRLTEGAIARLLMSVQVDSAFDEIVKTLSAATRQKVETAKVGYRFSTRREIVDDLRSAYSGCFEVAVLTPETGYLPHLTGSVGVKDKSLAQTMFEFFNSQVKEIFPLSSRAKDKVIFYRPTIQNLGLTPCMTVTNDSLLFADSISYLKTLALKSPVLFPPQDNNGSPLLKRIPYDASLVLYADNKAILKHMLAVAPLLAGFGINLPFDPALLPLPERAVEPFDITVASLRTTGTSFELQCDSDASLLAALFFSWVAGRSLEVW